MKPILFNTEMVRAFLAGQKTQTRRVVKCQPIAPLSPGIRRDPVGIFFGWYEEGLINLLTQRPAYQPGDILWVRETWANLNTEENPCFFYRATDEMPEWSLDKRWRPSIHMPKKAARLFLRVIVVRAERLQDITNADCVREGAVKRPDVTKRGDFVLHNRYRKEFGELWDSTIKKADRDRYGWAANPWVWVYTFERCGKESEE